MPETWFKTARSDALRGRTSKDTRPEVVLRSALHRIGLRFRLHRRIADTRLSVDIVLPRFRIAIFCDGCYWHRHNCRPERRLIPRGVNAGAWAKKLARVKERERRAAKFLAAQGFTVIRVWECDVLRDPDKAARRVRTAAKRSHVKS